MFRSIPYTESPSVELDTFKLKSDDLSVLLPLVHGLSSLVPQVSKTLQDLIRHHCTEAKLSASVCTANDSLTTVATLSTPTISVLVPSW